MNQQSRVAYFCMEYGLDADFHIYSGGLGILAGDYLKGAKDLNLPIVGIGIKWKQGYSEQMIKNGVPCDVFYNRNYDFLKDTGVKVTVNIRQTKVVCKVWQVDQFGNNSIYLLDTDIPENGERWITGQLYGWFGEERVAQEIVLGIGGVKALRALKIPVDVYHFNEGHAVLAGLELIKEKMSRGMSFDEALAKTRSEIVFTTHTPIMAGNESHPLRRLKYMGAFNGLTKDQMMAIGGEPFNMTVAALRLSRKSNAVAELHGKTANQMWKGVKGSSEIIAITNGIHRPTWVDPRICETYQKKGDLWATHMDIKQELVDFVRKRTGVTLNVNHLIIGFSRRAASYKRSDLIFRNPEIIEPLLKNQQIQLVFSGKSHPLDDSGRTIVSNLVSLSRRYPDSVVFLENYDMTIGKILTRGSDIWLNNPIRPMEASGTSGMKAAMNGVLNCSTLDGWWPEACQDGVNGWQFGNGKTAKDVKDIDAHDSKALYDTILNRVIPTYYQHREKWVEMMFESIKTTQNTFSTERMLKEYYELLYM